MKTRIVRSPASHHYGEAFPRLDLREARRQVISRDAELLWRNQRGDVIGQASVDFSEDIMTVIASFVVGGGQSPRVQQEQFHLILVGPGNSVTDCLAPCGSCGKSTRIFVMKDHKWLCRNCQFLGYRTSMVGQVVRQTERLDELEDLIRDGRPKGMHETTFQNLRRERAGLRLLLADSRLSPSGHYAEVITAYWQDTGPPLLLGGEPFTGGPLKRQ